MSTKNWLAAIIVMSFLPAVTRAGVTLVPGNLLVTDQMDQGTGLADGRVIGVDFATKTQTLIASGGLLADPVGVVLDGGGNPLIADFNSGETGALLRIDPQTGVQSVVNADPLPGPPEGVALDRAGNIYVSCSENGGIPSIVRVDPLTGSQTTVSSNGLLFSPEQMAFDAQGNLLVCDAQALRGGHGAVLRIDTVTGAQTVVSDPDLDVAIGLALEPSGDILISDSPLGGPSTIRRVEPDTGAIPLLASGGNLTLTDNLAIAQDGSLLAADLDAFGGNGGIIAIDRQTGAQTPFASGGYFFNPSGIAVVPEPSAAGALLASTAILGLVRRRRME